MAKFFESLLDPYFLMTAGVFAVFVNLISAYAKDPIDAVLGRVSKKRQERAEKKWEGLRDQANQLNDPELRSYAMWICTAWGQRAIWYLIAGVAATVATFAQMTLQIAVKEMSVASALGYASLLLSGSAALWFLYRALAYDNNAKRVQAALELREEFRQVLKQAHEDDEAANAANA